MPSDPGQYADSRNLSARVSLHARYSTNPKGWTNWLFEQLDLRAGAHVLELGAGPGGLWQGCLGQIPDSCQLVLSDISPGMASEARQAVRDPCMMVAVIDA